QQQRRKDSDDGNDHQQFNQGERTLAVLGKFHNCPTSLQFQQPSMSPSRLAKLSRRLLRRSLLPPCGFASNLAVLPGEFQEPIRSVHLYAISLLPPEVDIHPRCDRINDVVTRVIQ